MRRFCFLIFAFLTVSSSQGQVLHDSVLIDGHYRSFHFKKPEVSIVKKSLVFVLHGSGGSGLGMMKGAEKLQNKSATENILLVYPDGYKNFWNECRKAATSAANIENINEQAFFSSMIEYFKKNYQVNDQKVFAIGTSGGGHMAYKLALTMPGKFKAITAIIANLPDSKNMDCAENASPLSVMIINGTADEVNPYNGGEVKITGTYLGTVRSTEESFHYWAKLDGYKGGPVKEILADADPADGKTIEKYSYKTKRKPEVALLKVIGGRHDYPNDIDVYLEAWNFFKRNSQ